MKTSEWKWAERTISSVHLIDLPDQSWASHGSRAVTRFGRVGQSYTMQSRLFVLYGTVHRKECHWLIVRLARQAGAERWCLRSSPSGEMISIYFPNHTDPSSSAVASQSPSSSASAAATASPSPGTSSSPSRLPPAFAPYKVAGDFRGWGDCIGF